MLYDLCSYKVIYYIIVLCVLNISLENNFNYNPINLYLFVIFHFKSA